ncbi:hypothetical protein FHETE_3616 [Fusarium heterosporum]|uniref:Uncharacterized protein n=1 Tax=Fusarium heterosporum TaxID=42747 RepID=A0A8H5WRH8_FUSHE|nr:hypothetical protein FHETE_3616 [Fusarium heterosporum]
MNDQDHERSPVESPQWLTYLNTRIEEEKEEAFPEDLYYEIIRDMLLQSEDSEKAVSQAIDRFYKHYVAGFSRGNFGGREPPEYEAGAELNSISTIVFETIAEIPFADPKQDILSRFILGIAKNAADEFDEKNPQFVCYIWGIQTAAVGRWNAYHVSTGPGDYERPGVTEAIDIWLSTSALIAKLFQADLLGEYGPLWASADFRDALEERTDGDLTTLPFKRAQILAAADYISLSGEVFAREAKDSSKTRSYKLNAARWKSWAAKFQEVSDKIGEDVGLGLKQRAKEAHDRMVELYPEAFNLD